jgi:hypothetical protein
MDANLLPRPSVPPLLLLPRCHLRPQLRSAESLLCPQPKHLLASVSSSLANVLEKARANHPHADAESRLWERSRPQRQAAQSLEAATLSPTRLRPMIDFQMHYYYFAHEREKKQENSAHHFVEHVELVPLSERIPDFLGINRTTKRVLEPALHRDHCKVPARTHRSVFDYSTKERDLGMEVVCPVSGHGDGSIRGGTSPSRDSRNERTRARARYRRNLGRRERRRKFELRSRDRPTDAVISQVCPA